MTFKRFLQAYVLLLTLGVAAIVGLHVYMDTYGLFRSKPGQPIALMSDVLVGKYLLSQRYIPNNFEGIIIGPSFSANMDPDKLEGYKVYNLSINGANLADLLPATRKAIRSGKMKFLIICLDPYLTRDMKNRRILPGEQTFFASFGSLWTLRNYKQFFVDPTTLPAHQVESTYNGFVPYLDFAKTNWQPTEWPPKGYITSTHIDPESYQAMKGLLKECRSRGVRIFAYFYPCPGYRGPAYETYQQKILKLFTKNDTIWFQDELARHQIVQSVSNYADGTHLTAKGAGLVLKSIHENLESVYGRLA